MLDDTGIALDTDGTQLTTVELVAPEAKESDDAEPIDALANAVVAYLAAHGGRFESQSELKDGLKAARVTYDAGDLRPALLVLTDQGRLEWPSAKRGQARPGWLIQSNEVKGDS